MPVPYGIAAAPVDGAVKVLIRREGRCLPLSEILGGAEADEFASLGGDPMMLFGNWGKWREVIDAAVDRATLRFQSEGATEPERFALPTGIPNKLVCIGANYHDHIAEMAAPMVPAYPYSFLKAASTTLRGSGELVSLPKGPKMIDWEAELAVVIGYRCSDVQARDALSVVAGYTNFNDLSARDCIAAKLPIGVDWILHKSYDGFGPIGPYFVPARFVPDPQSLPVRLSVNGIVKQNSNTSQMIFGVAEIIAHLSSVMTLEPGDIIATGTPAGCGFGRKPQEFLSAGDEMEVEIGPLGVLRTALG